jgi:hypothetical protein
MKNFKLIFPEAHRETVLSMISRSNDIVLNQLEPACASITIQLEDDQADVLYSSLVSEIDARINPPEVVVLKPNC